MTPTHPPAQASDEPMRADFEAAYWKQYPLAAGLPGKFDRDEDGDYIEGAVYVGWDMYRAALKAQPAPTETQGEGLSPVYAWLERSTRNSPPEVANAARMMMAFYQGAEFPGPKQGVDVDDLIVELGLEKEVGAARVELMAMSDADIEEISQTISARVMALVKSPENASKTAETRMNAEVSGAGLSCSSCGLTVAESRMLAVQGDAVIPALAVQGEDSARLVQDHTTVILALQEALMECSRCIGPNAFRRTSYVFYKGIENIKPQEQP